MSTVVGVLVCVHCAYIHCAHCDVLFFSQLVKKIKSMDGYVAALDRKASKGERERERESILRRRLRIVIRTKNTLSISTLL